MIVCMLHMLKTRSNDILLSSVTQSQVFIFILGLSFALQNTHLTALFPGLPGWAGTRKVKPISILLKQETVSGSGISRAICKSARRSRQITTPATHHSVFYRPDALPATQPTASKHWRHKMELIFSIPSLSADMLHRHRLRSASTEQLDVGRQISDVLPFLLLEQRCGMACQAKWRRPRRCRCSRTGWRHTCSAAVTKLFDFQLHSPFLVIISHPRTVVLAIVFTV